MSNWIYMCDKLPESPDFYLTTRDIGSEYIVQIDFLRGGNYYHDPKIIAWMPLPKPASVKKRNENE